MAKKNAGPQQQSMDGMERGNPKLDEMAEHYTELGDERKGLKLKIITHMKRLKKAVYNHGRFHVVLTEGAEGVRVTIDKADSGEE